MKKRAVTIRARETAQITSDAVAQEGVRARLQSCGKVVIVFLVHQSGDGFWADQLAECLELLLWWEAAGEAVGVVFGVVEGGVEVGEWTGGYASSVADGGRTGAVAAEAGGGGPDWGGKECGIIERPVPVAAVEG